MNMKSVLFALLAASALWFGGCLSMGCKTFWRADAVTYTGKPGLLIEAAGNRVYLGLAGELHATGSAHAPLPEDVPPPEPEVSP